MSCKRLYKYAGPDHSWKTLLMAEGALDYLVPDRDKNQDDPQEAEKAKQNLPHNKVKALKKELETLQATEKQLVSTLAAAEQALQDASTNPPFEEPPPLLTILQTLFPSSMIQHTFKTFDYNTFLNVMNYIIQVHYINKDLKSFAEFKHQFGGLTDDVILEYTQTLYELLDMPDYKLIHEKLFHVNRLLNAIKRREWGLVSPSLDSIESNVKELYASKAKERAIQKAQDALEDIKGQQTTNRAQIEAKQQDILAATEAMVATTEALAANTEQKVAAAATQSLAESTKARFEQSELARTAEEAAKQKSEDQRIKSLVDAKVKEQVPPIATATATATPIPTSPYGVAAAITKAVGDVLERVAAPAPAPAAPAPAPAAPAAPAPAPAAPVIPAPALTGGTRKQKLVRRRLTKKVRFNLMHS
jgi:hypothetical protein